MKYKIGVKLAEGMGESLLSDTMNALKKVESDHDCVFEFYTYSEERKSEVRQKANNKSLNQKQNDLLFSFGG